MFGVPLVNVKYYNTVDIEFQIVCGITGLVMGMVAIIEEKGKMNLGLAIPAGILTVVAAGVYEKFIDFTL